MRKSRANKCEWQELRVWATSGRAVAGSPMHDIVARREVHNAVRSCRHRRAPRAAAPPDGGAATTVAGPADGIANVHADSSAKRSRK